MWRPDRTVVGPERATRRDIDALNHVFSDAFTERYRRDGLSGVRVPFLNAAVWQFALDNAGEGAMIWRDGRGDLIAFNMAHRSGTEGWMGPLAVRTDRQGHGLGRTIVLEGVAWLEAQGVQVIGLETMPRTIDNIGFYSRLGFVPGHLTVTLQRDVSRRNANAVRVGTLSGEERAAAIRACAQLAGEVMPGADFTRELELTLDQGLGDASLVHGDDRALRAFVLWHHAPLAHGRAKEELRVLKLVACDEAATLTALAAAEDEAVRHAMPRLSVRCQTAYSDLYAALVREGFRVHWTDLRMTLAGRNERERRGILLSNWEI